MRAQKIDHKVGEVLLAEGQILVTATPAEWRAVIHRITQASPAVEDDSDRLVYHLISEGVYE